MRAKEDAPVKLGQQSPRFLVEEGMLEGDVGTAQSPSSVKGGV